ncbi:hypothetical protein B0H21DRAFT_691578 [Amylocystis lapponica]|nr:hypothetical protein B0H21DRAFT_691578 [Amylocystis lapponica]
MAFDSRGNISVLELVAYHLILVLIVSVLLLKNGHSKKSGWIFLMIFCIMRETGAFTHIIYEASDKSITTAKIVYSICEQSGVSLLLLATLGCLETAAQNSVDDHVVFTRGTTVIHRSSIVAMVLAIIGGVNAGNATTELELNSVTTLRRIGSLMYGGVTAAVIFVALFLWNNRCQVKRYRHVLLKAVMATLPFLALRVLYTILSAFAPPTETSASRIGEFSSTTGSWALYLIMSVLTEFVIIAILIVVGIWTSPQKDNAAVEGANRSTGSNEELTGRKNGSPMGDVVLNCSEICITDA